MKLAAVVLAAGSSSRFGRPKQLLEVGGESLVSRACRIALESECGPVLAVLGAHAGQVVERGLPPGVDVVINERWEEGMGGSIACGVAAAAREQPDAVVILLADQPGWDAGAIGAMRKRLVGDTTIVQCRQGGIAGPPVLFASEHFTELMGLGGDEGGRPVIERHRQAVAEVDLPGERWDLDDEASWRRFQRAAGAAG